MASISESRPFYQEIMGNKGCLLTSAIVKAWAPDSGMLHRPPRKCTASKKLLKHNISTTNEHYILHLHIFTGPNSCTHNTKQNVVFLKPT